MVSDRSLVEVLDIKPGSKDPGFSLRKFRREWWYQSSSAMLRRRQQKQDASTA